MTRDELEELEEDLNRTEDWAPKTNYLVTRLFQEYAEQRAEIERLTNQLRLCNTDQLLAEQEIARLQAQLAGWQELEG